MKFASFFSFFKELELSRILLNLDSGGAVLEWGRKSMGDYGNRTGEHVGAREGGAASRFLVTVSRGCGESKRKERRTIVGACAQVDLSFMGH
jgi:hypothetical protein